MAIRAISKLMLLDGARFYFLFLPGSPKTPLDMSRWGPKIILFISNMYAGFFSYRAGLFLTR